MTSPARMRRLPRRRARRFNRVHRILGSVSARLFLVILLSVVPVAALGGLMAWHNYRTTLEASSNRAALVAGNLAARLDQQVAGTQRLIQSLADRPDLLRSATCGDVLRLVVELRTVPLSRLAVLDPATGDTLCGGGAPVLSSGTLGLPAAGAVTAVLAGVDSAQQPILRLSQAVAGPRPLVLMADLRVGWDGRTPRRGDSPFAGQTRAWLVEPDGRTVSLCAGCGSLPPSHRSTISAQGRYLERGLVGHLALLVTTEPSRAESAALTIFVWRVVAIVLVLVICLAAVLIGAFWLITAPLRAVTRSVTEWKRAGAYDPRPTRWTPIELRQLSRAFGEATQSLAAHEERLRLAEDKQALLIKEIHHRVKNNLQIIASLLNLQANRIRVPEARAEFASARDRVRALATLHRHLYSEGEFHTLNMRSFLEELCGQLFQAIGEKEGRRIRLEIEAPEIVMSTDQAVPLALVVTEAVSNAIKYAFPGGRSGSVSVRLAEEVEGIATLMIQDDGIGIPAGRAETETGIRDGLGIQLIRGFARQLGATLDVVEGEPDADGVSKGTRYTLLVPLHPKSEAEVTAEQGAWA